MNRTPIPQHLVVKVRMTGELPEELSEIVGDLLGNLRSALDHAVHCLALESGHSKPTTQCFPFAKDAAHFENSLKGRCSEALTALHPLFRKFQPYGGGNEQLWQLNTLRGGDEHAMLLPVSSFTQVGGMGVSAQGNVTMPAYPCPDEMNDFELCTVGPGSKVSGKYMMSSSVIFGDVGSVLGRTLSIVGEVHSHGREHGERN